MHHPIFVSPPKVTLPVTCCFLFNSVFTMPCGGQRIWLMESQSSELWQWSSLTCFSWFIVGNFHKQHFIIHRLFFQLHHHYYFSSLLIQEELQKTDGKHTKNTIEFMIIAQCCWVFCTLGNTLFWHQSFLLSYFYNIKMLVKLFEAFLGQVLMCLPIAEIFLRLFDKQVILTVCTYAYRSVNLLAQIRK